VGARDGKADIDAQIAELQKLREELSLRLEQAREDRKKNWQTLLGAFDTAAHEEAASSEASSAATAASSSLSPASLPPTFAKQAGIEADVKSRNWAEISPSTAVRSPGSATVTVMDAASPLSLKQLDKAMLRHSYSPQRGNRLKKRSRSGKRDGLQELPQSRRSGRVGHDSLREAALLDIMQREAAASPASPSSPSSPSSGRSLSDSPDASSAFGSSEAGAGRGSSGAANVAGAGESDAQGGLSTSAGNTAPVEPMAGKSGSESLNRDIVLSGWGR